MSLTHPDVLVRRVLEIGWPDGPPVVLRLPEPRKPGNPGPVVPVVRVACPPARRTSLGTRECPVAVQVYAGSDDEAWPLCERVRSALERAELVDPEVLGWIDGQDPHEWPDPDRPTVRRWQVTGTLIQSIA